MTSTQGAEAAPIRWSIERIGDEASLFVTGEGIWIELDAIPSDWRQAGIVVRNPSTRLGRQLAPTLAQLEDLELVSQRPGGFLIPHEKFVDIETHEIDAFSDVLQWSPFSVALASTGWLG